MARTLAMFTDTSLCIGCRACQVACKQWNELPMEEPEWTGGYQNHAHFTDKTYRLVRFIEKPQANGELQWLLMSDVCKHCERAGCLEACPTGAIVRTEHGSIYIQPDVCNGCGYCVPACPFGVVARREDDGRAFKCTLCYDRLAGQLEPACAKACPTDSIQFGPLDELRAHAADRVAALGARGVEARLYGESEQTQPGTGGLHAFFLITDEPETYNLPPAPAVPTIGVGRSWLAAAAGALGMAVLAFGSLLATRT
ncbi:MAG: 4Fe-4S dicluster domain-containing protein [bacterium]